MAEIPELAFEIRKAEAELGLPSGLVDGLAIEDDWSFMIKTHALLEAGATFALTSSFGVELEEVFSQLELSNQRTGKTAFLSAIGEIDSDTRTFIQSFSELRNGLVHSVKRVDFSFAAHIDGLDKNQKKSFQRFCAYYSRHFRADVRAEILSKCLETPKTSILLGAIQVMMVLYGKHRVRVIERQLSDISRQAGEQMLSLHASRETTSSGDAPPEITTT